MAHFVVVGAGIAGLTVAERLAAAGEMVTVLERDGAPGGLARSFRYGAFTFDVGPHRFHTEDLDVRSALARALGGDPLEIRRASAVHAFGAVHAWPLRAEVLWRLPPRVLVAAARDLLSPRAPAGESFEDEIVARYGRTLYEVFFRPYTERFLGLPAAEVHRDWARAGIDRAVIDRRVRAGGLGELLRGALLPRAAETVFTYPRGGIGVLAERLVDAIRARGGTVRLGAAVTGLRASGDRLSAVEIGAERIDADAVVWTGSIVSAAELIGEQADLTFLSTILFNLEVRGSVRSAHQWIYFAGDAPMARVSFPVAFSPAAAPAGWTGVCVERTCREGDDIWRAPERLTGEIVDALRRTGVLAAGCAVGAVHVERVSETYPIYRLGYRAELAAAIERLERYGNLTLLGRSARFWYNNMDHSIAQSLRAAAALQQGRRPSAEDLGDREFWVPRRQDCL